MAFFYDKRQSQRFGLLGYFPGSFCDENEKVTYQVHPIDISANGLGVLIQPTPSSGQIIIYSDETLDITLRLIAKHNSSSRSPSPNEEDLARCGLICDNEENLLTLLSRCNSLMIQE
jgi:hypothetical protein